MKTKLTTLIILASLVLTACKPQNKLEPYIGEYTELLAELYSDYYCDYPKTIDELLEYYQDKEDWSECPNGDTIQAVLSFLDKEKDNIRWVCFHPTVTSLTIGGIYKNDTLFYDTREWFFPCLYDKIYFYIKKHLEYPKSLNELLCFDSIEYGKPDFWEPECCKVTRQYLWDNRDRLEWIVDDDNLLIKSSRDTIFCEIGMVSRVRCYKVPEEIRTMVFVDTHGKYDYTEETRKSFMAGMRSVMDDYLNKNGCKKYELYMVEYRRGTGFCRLCENDDFPLDTEWFKDVGKFTEQFTREHNLERILFYTPAY